MGIKNLETVENYSATEHRELAIDGGQPIWRGGTSPPNIYGLGLSGAPDNTNVKCGVYYDAASDLPPTSFIENFGVFTADGQYVNADSDGGRHAGILFGTESDGFVTGNTYVRIGGVYSNPSYGSGIPITLNDLGVLARVQTSSSIIVYWKGFPIGIKEFAGSAVRNFDDATASGILYLGGTDHNGKKCTLVWTRIAEGTIIPFTTSSSYAPSTVIGHNSYSIFGGDSFAWTGMWDMSNPNNTQTIPDISSGFETIAGQGKVLHHGYLSDGVANRQFHDADLGVTGKKPKYRKILFGQSPFVGSIPAPPAGALVYDSHSRTDITKQWSKTISPGVGELGGNWQGETSYAGIVSQYLALSELWHPVWKVSPVNDYEVTFTRANSPYLRTSGHYEEYCPKMIDADNMLSVTFDPYGYFTMADKVSRYGGGDTTTIGSNVLTGVGQNWTAVKFRFVGTTMQVYIDNVLRTTEMIPARWATATKAGLMDTSDNYRKLKSILIKAA